MISLTFDLKIAKAGEFLTQEMLVKSSVAIFEVEYNFEDEAKPNLKMIKQLMWPDGDFDYKYVLSSACLPKSNILEKWLVSYKNWPETKIWKTALETKKFTAVIFFKKAQESQTKDQHTFNLAPNCDNEVLKAENWSIHPNYANWKTKLISLIK